MLVARYFRIPFVLAAVSLLALACTRSDPVPTSPTIGDAPIGPLADTVVPRHYHLALRIDPGETRFSGDVEIDVTLREAAAGIWLHGKGLSVSDVHLESTGGDRTPASYEERLESGVALVALESPVEAGDYSLRFTYDATFNTSTNALFRVERDGNHYAATQFQPIAARQVFPGFDDPGYKVPFDITLIARADHVAITNTPEVSAEELADGYVRRVFATTRPMPTYLLAFAVGAYDVVDYGEIPPNAVRDRALPLRGLVAKGLGDRLEYALKNTDGILSVMEEYFGSGYPYRKLDLIAMPESFGGAMENIGAITYDEILLLMDEDSPIQQRRNYTAVHAHEIAHMWFGNLVTPEWWTDIWLNESFASWMMYKAADEYWPAGEFDREVLKDALGAMANDSLAAARQIREPILRNEQIEGAFDGITYAKGGGVLAMLERYVGEDAFRAGIRLHMDRHADSVATADDFIASVAEGSDRTEIEAAFKTYIEQPGVPLLTVELDCAESPSLVVSQARYAPLGSSIDTDENTWHVPMCVSFTDGDEQKSSCALISERTQTVELDAESCPSTVHPNADGAGYYRFALDDAGWASLLDTAQALPAAEALVLADSLGAAFGAGRVEAEQFVAGMAALVAHDAWDVADAATEHLENVTQIISDSDLPTVEAALRRIAKPRYRALPADSDPGTQLLRQRLTRFLVIAAKDQELRAPMARQAAARVGLDGPPDPSAAPVNELETILSVGVQDLGVPFFDRLLAQASAAEDPAFRNAAIRALARAEDPALVAKLQSAVLEGKFRGVELVGILFRQMAREATRDGTYRWLAANYDEVTGLMPEFFRSRVVPGLGSWYCSADMAEEWGAFVESHAAKLPGYERELAQALERIRLCAGLREEKAEELVAAFASRAG